VLEPIKKSRISDEVVEQLCEMIVSGEYPAGGKMQAERDLADRLGITRSSLREALRRMESMGLIKVRPGDGIYVQDFREQAGLEFVKFMLTTGIGIDEESLRSIAEVRQEITFPMLKFAAERIGEAQIEQLEEIMAEFPGEVTSELLSGEWDFRFFHAIAKASGNQVFVYMLNTVRDMFGLLKWFYPRVADSLDEVLAIDRSIVEALREHDVDGVVACERERVELLRGQFLVGEKTTEADGDARKAANE